MKDGAFDKVKRRLELLEHGEELPKNENVPNVIIENKLDKIIYELRLMNCKQNTMKNIMVFWLVLTIINLIGEIVFAVYIVSNLIKAIK